GGSDQPTISRRLPSADRLRFARHGPELTPHIVVPSPHLQRSRRGAPMATTGGCHCGAIRYEAEGQALTHALCHCTDCRRHAGAPMVGWTMYPLDAVKVTKGSPKVYASSAHGRRYFCP